MSKEKKIKGVEYLFASIFVIAGAFILGWHLTRSVVITEVALQGNLMVDGHEILQTAAVTEGQSADSLNLLQIIDALEQLPWISSAHVSLSPSGRFRIRVKEDLPMALLVDGGRRAWATDSGQVYPVILGARVDVPILYGFSISGEPDTLQCDPFRIARDFLQTARNYPGMYALISEMMVTHEEGVVALSNENGIRLTFGHDRFEDKFRKWRLFQSQVVAARGAADFQSLDFRFRNQIVARE